MYGEKKNREKKREKNISDTIHTRREIQCLLYAGFLNYLIGYRSYGYVKRKWAKEWI